MTESSQPDRSRIARQLKQQVQALQAAGVEFVPTKVEEPLPVESVPAEALLVEPLPKQQLPAEPVVPVNLFDAGDSAVEATAELTPEARRQELTVLAEQVAGCTRCSELVKNRTKTVFGNGPIDAELCFIGEAPGMDEDRQGQPFVGAAGQLLNRIIVACGFKREEVYVCNICKCRPPGNRQPLPDEAGNCREFLERQLELVQPKFICALGATAAQNLLGTSMSIGRLRGSFQQYRNIPVMCTYHPAFLLRTPERKRDVWDDMKRLLQRMGRPIPGQ
jgi:uracil-DNA glycosylase